MLLKLRRYLYTLPKQALIAIPVVLILLIALLAFALSSCGQEVAPEIDVIEPEVVETVAPVEPEPEPEQEPEPEPEPEPEFLYYNPLTGEGTDSDIENNRPYAVMMNNLKIATPQLGISQADIIFEIPAEGGITRMLAIYQSVEDVGEIGSVRSARDYYVAIAAGLDAFFLHAGGSDGAYTAIKSLSVTSFDCVNGPYEGTLYWRDAGRVSSMGLEHSVLTSGETITELFAEYNVREEHNDSFVSSFNFSDSPSLDGAVDISQLSVTYSYYKTGVFTYDEASGLYLVEQYDAPYIDGNNNEQVAVRNVLVLRTDISAIAGDDAGRLDVRTTGTGTGLFLCDGQAVEISWSRSSLSAPFQFFTTEGEPLYLGVGTSYINIVDDSYEVDLIK